MITVITRIERWSWRQGCVLLAGIVLACVAQAGTLSPTARVEIAALLNRLETSGCQFNRNGTWYAATDARAHLQRKLDYLENRGLVESAEQFIDRGASTSSMTGQAYLVKCGSEQPVESQAWLRTQLRALRAAAAPMPHP
jgi:hypothetical protein